MKSFAKFVSVLLFIVAGMAAISFLKSIGDMMNTVGAATNQETLAAGLSLLITVLLLAVGCGLRLLVDIAPTLQQEVTENAEDVAGVVK